jgi:hypothetical protein
VAPGGALAAAAGEQLRHQDEEQRRPRPFSNLGIDARAGRELDEHPHQAPVSQTQRLGSRG